MKEVEDLEEDNLLRCLIMVEELQQKEGKVLSL